MIINNFKLLSEAEPNAYLLVSLDVVYLHYVIWVYRLDRTLSLYENRHSFILCEDENQIREVFPRKSTKSQSKIIQFDLVIHEKFKLTRKCGENFF